MALMDLSQVTETFITILQSRLPTFADWPIATTLTASAAPPDSVGANHAVSFYLYHVKEAAHTKAQDWQIQHDCPLRYKSMGLTLYYIMTPRSNISDVEQRAYADQLTLGLALKTLHELPFINDTTTVDSSGGPVLAMPLALRGRNNQLRVTLRPTAAEDAAEYWQAGTQAARLSAYYEVDAVLLEPEQRPSQSGRVYAVGVHTFARKAPQVTQTQNTISFTLPGESDIREIQHSPAQVALGDTLEVLGSDLQGDYGTQLLLSHQDFVEPLAVDAPWSVDTNGSRLTAVIQSSIGAQVILPGVYHALVETIDRRRLPNGDTRDFPRRSNPSLFAIAPRILAINLVATEFVIQVQGFEPHLLSAEEILLFVGSERLERVSANPPGPGEFVTPAAPPVDTDKIILRLSAGLSSGDELAIRLVVRGVESAPNWIMVP
ncbi:MAG: DUF4255 domain-containing protein [Gammaproteobacteria bacterium]|nr:DUF4255 domain-containing protein [Gammaproteobacteria bacterium]NVK86989.1 DUF4255 domain-containing protein [Gammaproteobacteria bacterium]